MPSSARANLSAPSMAVSPSMRRPAPTIRCAIVSARGFISHRRPIDHYHLLARVLPLHHGDGDAARFANSVNHLGIAERCSEPLHLEVELRRADATGRINGEHQLEVDRDLVLRPGRRVGLNAQRVNATSAGFQVLGNMGASRCAQN